VDVADRDEAGRAGDCLGDCSKGRSLTTIPLVFVADGELRTEHSFYLAGQRFLTLHYEIERLATAPA
jgi:hypothetical protein